MYNWFNQTQKLGFQASKRIVFGYENWFWKVEPNMCKITFFTYETVEALLD